MKKLQENHNELQTTIMTLQKMAISPPKEVLDQLTQVLGLLATVGEVSESITEIKNISLGLQRLERKCEGDIDSRLIDLPQHCANYSEQKESWIGLCNGCLRLSPK
jgi:hypothetical protein